MTNKVEFRREAGGSIFVEMSESDLEATGFERASRAGDLAVRAEQAFETALEAVRPIAISMIDKLGDLRAVNEVTIEFGIKLSATVGVILASGATDANFTVKLSWNPGSQKA